MVRAGQAGFRSANLRKRRALSFQGQENFVNVGACGSDLVARLPSAALIAGWQSEVCGGDVSGVIGSAPPSQGPQQGGAGWLSRTSPRAGDLQAVNALV